MIQASRSLLLVSLLAIPAAAKESKADPVPPSAAVVAPARTQNDVAMDFIYHLLMGHRDSVAMLFEEGMREKVTPEIIEGMQGQFKWLYNFIRGDFEQYMSGFGYGDSSFFREYRMSNESNKRYPLVLIQVVYLDSVSLPLVGAQVKSFLGGNEKRLAEGQIWKIGEREYDLHAIVVSEIGRGNILAVQYFDDDTAALSQETVSRNGIPLAREAVARGYLDSARTKLEPGKVLLDEEVGVVFIRQDPREGLIHAKVGFTLADLGLKGAASADSGAAEKAKAKPAAVKPASKKKK